MKIIALVLATVLAATNAALGQSHPIDTKPKQRRYLWFGEC